MTDAELIDQHRRGSDTAFAELVQRHVDWVYALARRRVGNPHLAEDVVQATFIVLHQKAAQLRKQTVLPAWLFRVVMYAAANAVRLERRRRYHETEAAMIPGYESPAPEHWQELAPILDDLVAKLRQSDREAVLLRFYRRMSWDEAGTSLGISSEAARKRVDRAIEKLRDMAKRRGITMAAGALPGLIWTNLAAEGAAPPGVAAAALTAAVTPIGIGAATSTSIAKGAMTMMMLARVKVAAAFLASLMIVGATGTTVVTQLQAQSTSSQDEGVADEPRALAIGEVVERRVGADGSGREMFLDFETGRIAVAARESRSDEQLRAWFREEGIDAVGDTPTRAPMLVGIDMAVLPVVNEEWESEDPLRGVRNYLRYAEPAFPAAMSAIAPLPKTYLFKTREGTLGIVQILELQERDLKIRYRLLEANEGN